MATRWAEGIGEILREHTGYDLRLAIDRADPILLHPLNTAGTAVIDA